jgi:hypothetical protein
MPSYLGVVFSFSDIDLDVRITCYATTAFQMGIEHSRQSNGNTTMVDAAEQGTLQGLVVGNCLLL